MNNSPIKTRSLRTIRSFGRVLALLGLLAGWLGWDAASGAEPSLTKQHVEAVFLLNFAKYVDWPAESFADTNAPIVIGVLGTDPFGDDLRRTVEGKSVKGRPFIIKYLAADSEMTTCHILFISGSEAGRMRDILNLASSLPILTVGEHEEFARHGGIINFVLKNDNVRLEIDLASAKKAGVTISSRLLAVADVVKGKTN